MTQWHRKCIAYDYWHIVLHREMGNSQKYSRFRSSLNDSRYSPMMYEMSRSTNLARFPKSEAPENIAIGDHRFYFLTLKSIDLVIQILYLP
jgi:hypothetical protein